jgi:hypothetical protein
MRKFFYLSVILPLALSCSSEMKNVRSDLETSNLKGKVWKIEKTVHNALGKPVCPAAEKDECNNSVFVYNKNGYLTELSELDENGNISSSSKYIYSSKDLCKEIEKYSGNAPKGKEVNVYKNGQLKEVMSFNEQGEPETICSYDYTGQDLTAGKIMNKAGELISSFRNEYSNGQLCKQIALDKSGNPVSITTFIRNEKNDIVEYRVSTPKADSEFKVINEYEYDNLGNWVKKTQKYDGEIVGIVMRNITYYNS